MNLRVPQVFPAETAQNSHNYLTWFVIWRLYGVSRRCPAGAKLSRFLFHGLTGGFSSGGGGLGKMGWVRFGNIFWPFWRF